MITYHNEIIFVEGPYNTAKVLRDVTVELAGQLKNLTDVKNQLAEQAKYIGANAVINFTYGQKKKWFAADGIVFVGKGQFAIIDPV